MSGCITFQAALPWSMASQWTGKTLFPWLRALPFWSHPPLLHSSWLAILCLRWQKIWSLKLPRLFLPGSLCSYSLSTWNTFPIPSHSWVHLIIQILVHAVPRSTPRLSNMCIYPACHSLYICLFHWKLTFWNLSPCEISNQLINLCILLCFYSSVSVPSTSIEWKKNLHSC